MKILSSIFFLLCLTTVQTAAAQGNGDAAQSKGAEWISYRDVYRSMLWFEKFGQDKTLIQQHLQLVTKDKNLSLDQAQLRLHGTRTQLNLVLDATGRVKLPLLKTAYDENAELVVQAASAQLKFYTRISLNLRSDGLYEISELRRACEQALAYQNYFSPASVSGKKCAGIRIAFDKREANTNVELRPVSAPSLTLPLTENAPIWPDTANNFKVINLNFNQLPNAGQIYTRSAPLVMIALFE